MVVLPGGADHGLHYGAGDAGEVAVVCCGGLGGFAVERSGGRWEVVSVAGVAGVWSFVVVWRVVVISEGGAVGGSRGAVGVGKLGKAGKRGEGVWTVASGVAGVGV